MTLNYHANVAHMFLFPLAVLQEVIDIVRWRENLSCTIHDCCIYVEPWFKWSVFACARLFQFFGFYVEGTSSWNIFNSHFMRSINECLDEMHVVRYFKSSVKPKLRRRNSAPQRGIILKLQHLVAITLRQLRLDTRHVLPAELSKLPFADGSFVGYVVCSVISS